MGQGMAEDPLRQSTPLPLPSPRRDRGGRGRTVVPPPAFSPKTTAYDSGMPFGPVNPDLDLPALERAILARWQEGDIVARTRRLRDNGEPWIFYEGPPTANGRPGLHHVWARVFKDIYPRFQTMRGRSVPRKGGWDCHGLPVELEVEKELGLSTKQEIEEFGIAEFNRRCRESVQRYVADWETLTERAGVWIDTADAYWTLDNDYIESVWWLVRQLWDKGLLYEGHKVSPYCGRCGTALSSHELGQPDVYRDVVDPSVFVRFPVIDEDFDLLVWTTTPWTLVSNVAVAVNPDVDYVRVRSTERDLVMAAALAPDDAEVVATFPGRELLGRQYRRPFETLAVPPGARGWRVVAGDFVTTDDGSGLVHLAPAFGEDDATVGRMEGLPVLNPVNGDAAFDESVPEFAGLFVKDADRRIIEDLERRGLLVREQSYEHSYPHCWRCGTALIYWAKTSWFVRTSEHRDVLLRENERIEWHPEFIKDGRFGKWLEGNIDWALSRDRYWGTPLPIWRCESNGHETCIGSVDELSGLAGRDLSELDLHRPFIDEITFACPTSGCHGTARRVAPVLDAWFDSGSMPSAQRHHPFEGAQEFDNAFPADFICEAIDQTRGWFYSLLAVNSLVFGSTPYRNVVCLALIVDEHGQKMSKSRGNVIAPAEIFDTQGADALRWYFFSSGQPWTPRRVFPDGIREATRQTLLTFWNVYSFFATYADLDGWEPTTSPSDPSHVLDRWILSELDATVEVVTEALEGFDALTGANRLTRFIDDLSNWYVRRSRPRFWKSSDPDAHATLFECLVTTSALLAPFCPFLADEIHTRLTGGESVHLTDWPVSRGRVDAELAEEMAAARRLVVLGRAARTEAKVRVRQPLSRALVLHGEQRLTEEVQAEIRSELNVRALERLDTLTGLLQWTIIPNFRTLGPRLGPRVNDVKAALASADGSALKARMESVGAIVVAGETLTADDVEIRAERHEDLALVEDEGWAVALDLDLDDELRAEGTARELIRALNDSRKEAGLAISDRIEVELEVDGDLRRIVEDHWDTIGPEVLATGLRFGAAERWIDLDGRRVGVTLRRVGR